MNRLPDSVQRQLPDGDFERVTVRRLQAGDVIRVLPGETFPADGTVLQGATQADEALLTGESRAVPRAVGDQVIAGSHNLSAVVLVRVDRAGVQTRFAQIVALMENASTSKPQLAQLADRIAKPFMLAVLLAAIGAAVFWWGRDPAHALMVAVAVLVVTCPCALSLATPVAMLAAAGSLARSGVLVRRMPALETLAGVDMVVFDKTGTLTNDAMVLGAIHVRPDVSQEQVLGMAAALAQHSLHPVSRALHAAALAREVAPWRSQEVRETTGQGVAGLVARDGKPTVQAVCLGSPGFCGVDVPRPQLPHACLSDELGWLATFELSEAVREDAVGTIATLQAQGIEIQLWSGDAPQAVTRVASRIGIDQTRAACTPQDKLRLLREAQQRGKKVAMVGDGMNDGPVLAGANVSFVIGQAVPLVQAQADFVVLGGQLARVSQTLGIARRSLRIVRQNLWWAASYNAMAVPLAVAGWMPAWLAGLGMASSSLLVVVNALRLSVDVGVDRR
jgi:Cu2+-exporting ATPase